MTGAAALALLLVICCFSGGDATTPTPPTECESNKVWTDCGTACPNTCGETQQDFCTDQCVAGCQCERGKWWDPEDHKCVAKNECTPQTCESNKVWTKCGTACPNTCGETQQDFCTDQCVAGCQCERGKWWDPEVHKCVANNECTPQTCESNKKWKKCTTHCPKTCGVTYHFCIAGCAPACACPKKKWWDPVKGNCVKKEQCKVGSRRLMDNATLMV